MAGIRMVAFWEKLRKYDANIYIGDEGNTRVTSVKMLQKGQTSFKPDILYIGDLETLGMDTVVEGPANFLILGEKVKNMMLYQAGKNNILSVSKNTDFISAFNDVQEVMAVYMNWNIQLHDAFIKGKGLDTILNIGYELLGNPIQVIDTSFKLIAGTKDRAVDDPVWEASNKNGFAPYAMVSQLKVERFIEKVHKSKEPIFVHPSIHKYTLLMSNIILEDKILGHMAVLEYERPFEESDIDLLKQLTEIVSSELLKSKIFRNSKGLAFENFITDLLYGKIKDPRLIDERIKALGWELQDCQYIMTIKAEQENLDNTPFPNFREMLENLVPYSKSVIYFDHLLLILNRKKDRFPLTDESLNELTTFLRNNQLKCGISRPFNNIGDIRKHYEQSLKSIDLGSNIKPADVVYIYDDYVIYHVLDTCKEKLDLISICSPVVLDLIEYDRKNKTHYALTLYTYLIQALNLTASAETLFIHHNTMRFRIEKIQKILNLELNDGNILFHLLLSFKALEYSGKDIFN